MKQLRIILLGVFALMASVVTVGAQTLTCWRITEGPGAGIVVTGVGTSVSDSYYGAFGHIANADRCTCVHFHGQIFGLADPNPENCGWGCVVQVPCTPAEAADSLHSFIDYIGTFEDPDLAGKLDDIFHTMEGAAAAGCYSVVDKLASAFADEIRAYALDVEGPFAAFDPTMQAMVEYVDSALDSLTYANNYVPLVKDNQVQILRRIGSGQLSRLIGAPPRITLPVGQAISLEALGHVSINDPVILWQYKWKGAGNGELPEGTAAAFRHNRITLSALKPISVRLNALMRYPDAKKPVKDTLLINWAN